MTQLGHMVNSALIAGEGFAHEEEIAWARERRDNAKYAILAHVNCAKCAHMAWDVQAA